MKITVSLEPTPSDINFYARWKTVGDVQTRLHDPGDADAWVIGFGNEVTNKVLDKHPKLKYIISPTTGKTHLKHDWRRVKTLTLAGEDLREVRSVAEYVFSIIFRFVRPYSGIGRTLYNKTIGVIGCGRIGAQVLEIAHGFGMDTLGFDPKYKSPDASMKLEALMALSDIVTLHVPEGESTRGMIGREEIKRMRKGTLLINTSRNSVWDFEAVWEATAKGRIYAASDFVDDIEDKISRRRPNSNFVAYPHLGGYTLEDRIKTDEIMLEKFKRELNANHSLSL